MNPFRHVTQRRGQRRYKTALTIYLAIHTYLNLPATDRDRVSAWVKELIDGKFNPSFSFKEFELFLPVYAKAAFWAVAMKSLCIPPAVLGEEWQIPDQPRWTNRFSVVNGLLRNWRPSNPTTTKAENYLKSKGVDVTILDPSAKQAMRQVPA